MLLGGYIFRGRTIMLYLILSMTMFPLISILSGLFTIMTDLGLFGSLSALIITYPIFTLPFTVWVLVSFFKGLPGRVGAGGIGRWGNAFANVLHDLIALDCSSVGDNRSAGIHRRME
jgi:trehalose/maltose transport system permease protein